MRKFIIFLFFSIVFTLFVKLTFPTKLKMNFESLKSSLYSFYYSNLEIRNISFYNLKNLDENNLKRIIPIHRGDSIFDVDFKKIEEKLLKKDEIDSLKISISIKGDLNIYITEEVPFMFWFDDKKKVLINRDGKVLNYDISKYNNLKFIKGKHANKHIKILYNNLTQFDEIYFRFNSAEYIENYRWNIKLNNNTIIKLPIFKIDKSLKILNDLLSDDKINNYKIVDLRVDGKIFLR